MDDGVTAPISVHREVSLPHYIIFIKTWRLFPLHLQLVRPPPLIPELYALLFPPYQNLCVA